MGFHKVTDRLATFIVRTANVATGFIEEDRPMAFRLLREGLSIDTDEILSGKGAEARLQDALVIDGDLSGLDQFRSMATRGDTSLGQNVLETFALTGLSV
jgi:hypothetical protein